MLDKWNERFSSKDYVYGEIPNTFYKNKLKNLTPGKILFVAEAEGRNSVYAAKLGWNVDAVDYSEEAKKKALQLAENNGVNINYIVADLNKYQLNLDEYDAVVLIFAHFDPDLREKIHSDIFNSLKKGGHLILQGYEKEQINYNSGGPKNIDWLYSLEEIYTDFQDMDFLEFEKVVTELDEGKLHLGKAAMINLYAQKI